MRKITNTQSNVINYKAIDGIQGVSGLNIIMTITQRCPALPFPLETMCLICDFQPALDVRRYIAALIDVGLCLLVPATYSIF